MFVPKSNRKLRRVLKIYIAALIAALSGVLSLGVAASASEQDFKVEVCHATGSTTNPYENGGGDIPKWTITAPNGHGVHSGDIIPPFSAGSHGGQEWADYPGLNWSEPFITIFNNDCEVVPMVVPETPTIPVPPVVVEPEVTLVPPTVVVEEEQEGTPEESGSAEETKPDKDKDKEEPVKAQTTSPPPPASPPSSEVDSPYCLGDALVVQGDSGDHIINGHPDCVEEAVGVVSEGF